MSIKIGVDTRAINILRYSLVTKVSTLMSTLDTLLALSISMDPFIVYFEHEYSVPIKDQTIST